MGAGDHFDTLAAMVLEFGEQRELLVGAEAVAPGVGDHRHAAGAGDPAHGVAQACPFVGDKAGLAIGQVFAEHRIGVRAEASFHNVAGKVGARDQIGVAHIFHGAFECARDAGTRSRSALIWRARSSRPPRVARKPSTSAGVGVVKTQADDVHRFAREGDRNLGAGEVRAGPVLAGGSHGAGLSAHFIVVGQCPEFNAVVFGALGQHFGGERAVGDVGVAVEIGVGVGAGIAPF